jgi:uncharacterized glyoxalase superfamily protein PhnB
MQANTIALEWESAPFLRYRNLATAIGWVCTTLGFKANVIIEDGNGGIRFAQLVLYNAVITLGSLGWAGSDKATARPDETPSGEIQRACFFVADVEKHYAHAKSLGAEIVQHIAGHSDGGRAYSCRDPEGNLWTFREFELWSHQPERRRPRWAALITVLSALLSIVMIGSTVALGYLHVSAHAAPLSKVLPGSNHSMKTPIQARFDDALIQARMAREAAERANEEIHTQLARQRMAKEAAQSSERGARDQAARERSLRLAAEHDRTLALARLSVMASQRELAEIAAREARDLAARERRLRLSAEQSREVALRRYKLERDARRRIALANRSPSFTSSW